jgi:nucleoside-diphosphate-sugar epimerase
VLAEQVIKDKCRDQSLEYVILRPCGLYGPGDTFVIYELMQVIYFLNAATNAASDD